MPHRFTKLILRPGHYRAQTPSGPKDVEITREDLTERAKTATAMIGAGLKIPAPWRHDDSVPFSDEGSDKNAGYWPKVWQGDDGNLWGELEVPRDEDASKVGTTVTEVSPLIHTDAWTDGVKREWDKPITHIALVTHPVMPGQTNFEKVKTEHRGEPVLALALSQFFAETIREPQAADQVHKVSAGTATVKDAVAALQERGIALPADTDAKNFISYLIVALNAVKAQKAADDDQQNQANQNQGLEQPLPIAMGGEVMTIKTKVSEDGKSLQFADAKDRETCQKALEAVEGKDKAVEQALAFATQSRRDSLKVRIESLVEKGKIPPAVATKKLKPLLDGYKFAVTSEGKPEVSHLEQVLEILEEIPENATGFANLGEILTGGNGSGDGNGKETRFAFEVQPIPAEYVDQTGDNMTDEQADKVVDKQFQNAGLAPSPEK